MKLAALRCGFVAVVLSGACLAIFAQDTASRILSSFFSSPSLIYLPPSPPLPFTIRFSSIQPAVRVKTSFRS